MEAGRLTQFAFHGCVTVVEVLHALTVLYKYTAENSGAFKTHLFFNALRLHGQ